MENEQALDKYRCENIDQTRMIPIWLDIKERQDIFNGFGAQESCDVLFSALIHPLMPTTYICCSETLWERLRRALIEHHLLRVNRVLDPQSLSLTPLPYLSGQNPFVMNTNGHKLYAAQVYCYRRSTVKLDAHQLTLAHTLGLFNPDAVLGTDGIATGL